MGTTRCITEKFNADLQNPFLRTRTSQSKREISLRRRMVCIQVSRGSLRLSKLITYRSCLQHGGRNTENRDEENADGVVVILVHGPQHKACHLEHVEGMKGLVDGGVRAFFTNWSTRGDHIPHQLRAEEQSSAEYQ